MHDKEQLSSYRRRFQQPPLRQILVFLLAEIVRAGTKLLFPLFMSKVNISSGFRTPLGTDKIHDLLFPPDMRLQHVSVVSLFTCVFCQSYGCNTTPPPKHAPPLTHTHTFSAQASRTVALLCDLARQVMRKLTFRSLSGCRPVLPAHIRQ